MRRYRRAFAAVLGFLFVGAAGVGGVAPAHAASKIETQPHTAVSGLDTLRAAGLDGTGVKIAIIDGPADLSVPELDGADVTVKNYCKEPSSAAHRAHGTAITSLLASPDFGWAPKASYTVYVIPIQQWEELNPTCRKNRSYSYDFLINQALTDGADLVTISVDGVMIAAGGALARADLLGVPVITAAGNENGDDLLSAAANLIVGVGANDLQGHRAKFSDYGVGLTLMAPGTDVIMREADSGGKLSRITRDNSGTSFAAPMVAGALALAMQAWPEANGNQLLNSLIATADRDGDAWDRLTGWGSLDAPGLVANDPTGLSTESPLIDKGDADFRPTPTERADYRDGLTDPSLLVNDDGYVYRGDDKIICMQYPDRCEPGTSPRFASATPTPQDTAPPSPAPSAPAATASDGASPALIGAGVVGGLAVLAAAGVFLRRRRGGS